MNRTYETICKLVSTAMFGSAISYEDDVDWPDVFEEMKIHGVASLVGDIINDIPAGDGIREKWKDYILQQQIYWKRVIIVQDDVCRVLGKIPYVILKGMSAAIYYPNPRLRSVGDIDVLVDRKDFYNVVELLKKNNYTAIQETGKRHNTYYRSGVEIELHDSYATVLTNAKKFSIENQITRQLDDTKKTCFEEHTWKALPRVENGLALIYHIFHHFRDGVGFRQIIDWMMFVNDSSNIDWNKFNRITKADGIYKFQCVITKMCNLYFGLQQKDSILWMDEANAETCSRVFDYISASGNFGRHLSIVDSINRFASGNILSGCIARLQKGGILRWNMASKYRILRPFAWIYQGVRVVNMVFRKERPIKPFYQNYHKSITELFNELGILSINTSGDGNSMI